MRALVFTAPQQVAVLDVESPTAISDEVLVDVAAVGVCGSDLHGISGAGWRQPPLVLGHEIAGTDPSGRRVAVNPLASCGECDSCLRGRPNLCRDRRLVGVHRPGGFAQQVAVPSRSLHELPATLGWDAAALIEPLANVVHAHALSGGLRGVRVGVIGAGALGLLYAALAAVDQPSLLTVADPSERRLEVATAVGAHQVVERLSGEYDVVLDAVGIAQTRQDSTQMLRPGGLAIWLGLAQPTVVLDANALVRDEKQILGSFAYTDAEFGEAVRRTGDLDLSWATSVPLEESAAVFLDLAAGRSDIVRAVIRP